MLENAQTQTNVSYDASFLKTIIHFAFELLQSY